MKRNISNLDEVPLYQQANIKQINCDEMIKRRLLDLGLVKDTKITPVLVSPAKDPRAFEVRGSIIAIRKEDAHKINIYTN